MKLYDIEDGKVYGLQELRDDWRTFRKEEPWNHAGSFPVELLEILMATVNGRNNCEVFGLTSAELDRFIRRIRQRQESKTENTNN